MSSSNPALNLTPCMNSSQPERGQLKSANIERYFKRGYCIINKKNPLTNTELPVCILRSVRLAYGQDERFARFHDYYDLGLKHTKEYTCHAVNSNNIVDEMNASRALVERIYQEFNII
jgi:hypothetical protein